MEECKATLASNLIRLRTAAGMTQAELGEKLNYSDKSVSKWERGDGTPDVFVLKQIADLYGVTVDALLTPNTEIAPKIYRRPGEPNYSTTAITLVSLLSIWTLALLAFVLMWIGGYIIWKIFIYAIPISLITFLVLHSLWKNGQGNVYIVSALVFSIILTIYLTFLPKYNLWQLLLVAVPAELIVVLSFRIEKKSTRAARRKRGAKPDKPAQND